MRRGLLICAGTLACAAASAAASAANEIDAAALLVKSAEASRTSNYQGVVIYRGDEKFEVLRVQHRFQDDSERERMVSLTGEPRQLVRIDNRLITILPKGGTTSVERPVLKGFLDQLTLQRVKDLKAFYDFRDEGIGHIAGRPCRGVTIAPRDGYRYGYEVWTDQQSYLPLKVSLIGPKNTVLEQVMFTEVGFPDSIPDSAFETEVDINRFNLVARTLPQLDAPAAVPVNLGETQVSVKELPPGFKIISHEDRTMPNGTGHVEHLLLSDGLSSVSVFSAVEQHQERAFTGVSHMGAMQAYGRTVGSFHITIIGEVPAQTIRLIGDGLRVPIPGITAPSAAPPAQTPPAPSVVSGPSATSPPSRGN